MPGQKPPTQPPSSSKIYFSNLLSCGKDVTFGATTRSFATA